MTTTTATTTINVLRAVFARYGLPHLVVSDNGQLEILSVASCYGNRDKLRPDGPLGPNADFTYTYLVRVPGNNRRFVHANNTR